MSKHQQIGETTWLLWWQALRLADWTRWHKHVVVKLVSQGIWTEQRVAQRYKLEDATCQLCNEACGTIFPQVLRVPSFASGRPASSGSQLARGPSVSGTARTNHSPTPLKPVGGILEGTLFTGGSSCGLGALRRAGLAADAEGNLVAATSGHVPVDLRPRQTSRRREFSLPTQSPFTSTLQARWEPSGHLEENLGRWRRGHSQDRRPRGQRLGNTQTGNFAKQGADTHKPPFRRRVSSWWPNRQQDGRRNSKSLCGTEGGRTPWTSSALQGGTRKERGPLQRCLHRRKSHRQRWRESSVRCFFF